MLCVSDSQRKRHNFTLNIQDVGKIEGIGEIDPQITVSVSASNERMAVKVAAALLKALKAESLSEQFEKAMLSGDYETSIG